MILMMKQRTLLLLVLFLTTVQAPAWAITAFEARNLARKEVNDIAKKNLVQIIGKPAPKGVLPIEWHVLFYDPYAQQNGTMLKIVGKNIVGIEDGYTQMDKFRVFAYKQEEVLDSSKLKKDSSDLLPILRRNSVLKGIKITTLGLWLKKDGKGPLAPAVWFVDIYANDLKGEKEVKFGTAKVNATTGQVTDLKVDLNKLGKKEKKK